jgi:predicted Zn finger-like uncharacterized protein
MIILCTRCQAKFRVADEKIGPRGAKVRCSKCGNVFGVHRDAGAMPAAAPAAVAAPAAARRAPPLRSSAPRAGRPLDIELEAGTDHALVAPPPPAPDVPDDPFAAVRGPAWDPDPSAGDAHDPFAASGSAFAGARDADPFASGAPAARSASSFDPSAAFAEAALGDPFVATVIPRPAAAPNDRSPSLPVTDLSDLLGAAAEPGGPPPVPEPPSEAPMRADLDPGGFAASALARGAEPFGSAGAAFEGGLELDHSSPGFEAPAGFAATGFAAPTGFNDPPFADPDDAIALDAAPRETSGLALGDGWGAAMSDARAPSAPSPRATPRSARFVDAAPQRDVAAPVAGAGANAAPAGRAASSRSPLRSLALNAVSLAALLFVVAALVVMWRGGGSVTAALRSTPLLAGFAGAPAVEAPFAARDVSSGLFDRDGGPPILYVRGTVASRAPRAVSGVRVAVDILRGEAVVARGEALAGAMPTPEELHGIRDAADLARRTGDWTRRAPVKVPPGAALPFVVAIVDVPADLTGTTVRVTTAALEPSR